MTIKTKKAKRIGPSSEPQKVSDSVWYYENPESLEFVVERRDGGKYHQTFRFRVEARTLLRSLKRMGEV